MKRGCTILFNQFFRSLLAGFFVLAGIGIICAQEQETGRDSVPVPRFFFAGYVKSLEWLSFDKDFSNNVAGNLIHNRLNLKWKPSAALNLTAEFRNRIFWGEQVKKSTGFAEQLKNMNEALDLQKAWINQDGLVFHTNTERLYIDLKKNKWNTRIGRQRINWGMSTIWNPNDLFNAYNFLDFDYEERSGVDGVKLQYLQSDFSNIEFVYSAAKNKQMVSAVRYFLNKWNYDLQLIAGWYKNQATLGTGWAGNIKDAGFKGEVQYYFTGNDSLDQLNITLGLDYMFKKGWYLNAGALYNSHGINETVSNWNTINLNLSSKNLMPGKYNLLLTGRKEITPVISASLSMVYSPGLKLLILLPGFAYTVSAKLDAELIWQSYFADINKQFQAINHFGFCRIRWSF